MKSPFEEEASALIQKVKKEIEHLKGLLTTYSILIQAKQTTHETTLPDTSIRDLQLAAPTYKMPMKQEYFLARDEEIKSMQTFVSRIEHPRRLSIFVIHGIGGVGKSRLALEFAWKCRDDRKFESIFWVEGETDQSMSNSFREIAADLELVKPGQLDDHNTIVFRVQQWLKTTSSSWLLVFDNVESFEILCKYLPTTPGHILVTTRYRHTAFSLRSSGSCQLIGLQPFGKEESMNLFKEMRKRYHDDEEDSDTDSPTTDQSIDEINATDKLLENLGGLPLGIEQMAAYIESEGLTVCDFLELYMEMGKEILGRNKLGLTGGHTLDTLWATSFDTIRKGKVEAHDLLCIASILSPENVKWKMFLEASRSPIVAAKKDTYLIPDFCYRTNSIETALTGLKEMALIRRSGQIFSIHRLTQEAFFLNLSPIEAQRAFDQASSIVSVLFPKSQDGVPLLDQWDLCQATVNHAISLANIFTRRREASGSELIPKEPLQELMKNCVWYLYERGRPFNALELLQKAKAMFPVKDTLIFAHLCNTAHVIYFEINDLDSADRELQKAFEIQANLLAENDTERANTHGNLGALKATQGKYEEAIEHFSIADDARVGAGSAVEIPHAINQTTHAWVLARMKQYDQAKERLDVARDIYFRHEGIGQLTAQ
ncbi:hypothetical protein ACHAPI_011422 [Fusarium lateritium]